ncbi:TerC family protein [Shewanella corallii]|uniref:TerC family protein n=1 Tax=Shewanella corallii TaxID=560080 RepID=A0ABT0N514_9GAMM|nr:TerC family protein [Shewanella corallii]MCL2913250.1 TerC family protein [Shewanella corallii]
MEFLTDPQIWAGLVTLIILEIVLGIDNLVFIAILVKKLPPHQRDKARTIGLTLALLMRLGLLSIVSWLVTLTQPLFSIGTLTFSWRDIILISGGLFLLAKATMELHERLEGESRQASKTNVYASFGVIIAQILALDAVFSLDSIITAVGMVDNLTVMMIAVVVAMVVMLVGSKWITDFVNAHPTVVVLCLSFLLMIGCSLVAEGFGFHIPKGYLYAAMGFSILIEAFNQLIRRNSLKREEHTPLRQRTTDAIVKLMGGRIEFDADEPVTPEGLTPGFDAHEREMVTGVLSLAERSVRTLMTPRNEICWLDIQDDADALKQQIRTSSHQLFPVCNGSLDELLGVVRSKDMLLALEQGEDIQALARSQPAMVVPDSITAMRLLQGFRLNRTNLAILTDEFGSVQGLVTLHDLLESIVGEFPDADELPEIIQTGDSWQVKGCTALHDLEHKLEITGLVDPEEEYVTVAGMLLAEFGSLPKAGESVEREGFRFEVIQVDELRILEVRVHRL